MFAWLKKSKKEPIKPSPIIDDLGLNPNSTRKSLTETVEVDPNADYSVIPAEVLHKIVAFVDFDTLHYSCMLLNKVFYESCQIYAMAAHKTVEKPYSLAVGEDFEQVKKKCETEEYSFRVRHSQTTPSSVLKLLIEEGSHEFDNDEKKKISSLLSTAKTVYEAYRRTCYSDLPPTTAHNYNWYIVNGDDNVYQLHFNYRYRPSDEEWFGHKRSIIQE